jgi:hypothetical protein
MKKLFLILVCLFLTKGMQAQNIFGAWEGNLTSKKGEKLRFVVIFADGYQVLTIYEATTGKFIHANGGTWRIKGDVVTEKVEFDTDNPARVGTEVSFKVAIKGAVMKLSSREMKFKRIDAGAPGKLQGAWLMSGRIRDGKTQMRDITRPRKTMKLLSGTRFQWIAYNTETKQFMGTGGGTYTTINGKYTENIEFFSRDNSKAGLSLQFDYTLKEGTWNHKGFSSKGDEMHELWSVRD